MITVTELCRLAERIHGNRRPDTMGWVMHPAVYARYRELAARIKLVIALKRALRKKRREM